MEKIWPLLVILAGLVAGTYIFWGKSATDTTAVAVPQSTLVYPYNILVTNEVIAEVVSAVAGKHATVTVLLPQGTDPRTFTIDEEALAKIAKADYVLINGRGLEANFEARLRSEASGKPVYGVADGLGSVMATRELTPGQPDPASWLNITAWKDAPLVVRDRLRAFDVVNQLDYEANAGRYRGQLEALSVYASTIVVSVPEQRRLLVTGDNFVGHLGAGTRLAVEATRPGNMKAGEVKPADARTVARIVDILAVRAPYPVFRQHGLDNEGVDRLLAAAAEKKVAAVDAGVLYTLVPGPSGTYLGTYVGMMDHNLTTMTIMLGGMAPSTGLNGKLTPPILLLPELAPADPNLTSIEDDIEAARRRQGLPTTLSIQSTLVAPTATPTPSAS